MTNKNTGADDCGHCQAGIVIARTPGSRISQATPTTWLVQACKVCNLFETDLDAAEAVESVLAALKHVYFDLAPEDGNTVADAVDVLRELCGVGE